MTAQTSATKANDTPVTDSGSVVPGTVDSANGADDKLDEAAKFLAEAANDYPAMTPDIEKQLVKKIDRWMIPIVGSVSHFLRLSCVGCCHEHC